MINVNGTNSNIKLIQIKVNKMPLNTLITVCNYCSNPKLPTKWPIRFQKDSVPWRNISRHTHTHTPSMPTTSSSTITATAVYVCVSLCVCVGGVSVCVCVWRGGWTRELWTTVLWSTLAQSPQCTRFHRGQKQVHGKPSWQKTETSEQNNTEGRRAGGAPPSMSGDHHNIHPENPAGRKLIWSK